VFINVKKETNGKARKAKGEEERQCPTRLDRDPLREDGVLRPVKLHGRLVGAFGNLDGSNHWEFYAAQKPSDAKTPSALGGGKKETAREVLRRKMSSQRGSFGWISPRGMATRENGPSTKRVFGSNA